MTTSERQITTPRSELISACRKSYGNTTRQVTPTIAAIPVGLSSRSGRGTAGSRRSTSSPRPGQARPAQEERQDDDEEDEELGEPAQRGSALVRREPALRRPVDQERLDHADPEAGEARDEERREPGEQGGGQGRNDLECERLRVERDQRRDQDAEPAGDDRGEHGVRDGQATR